MGSNILLLNLLATFIYIDNFSCNNEDCTLLDFSRFIVVESIEIGDYCFASVETFRIDGLNQLKNVKIGDNSFTQKRSNCENGKLGSFQILNCELLELIEIGKYSFDNFAAQFELKNLPKLRSIQIGDINGKSNNFSYSSFVIQGILNDTEYVMIRSS